MEQLVILVIIGLISLINWIIQKSAEAKEKARVKRATERGDSPFEPAAESSQQEPVADPQEGMRKLMEALGMPMEEEVPRPIKPRPSAPPPLPEETFLQAHTPEPTFVEQARPVTKVTAPQLAAARRFRQRRPSTPVEVTKENASRDALKKILSSKDSLKTAVIMSEVLGHPRSLRKSDPFAR